MPDDAPLIPGDRVKLTPDGGKRYPGRKGQRGWVVRKSVAAPDLVYVRWEGGTTDCHQAALLEIDVD